MSTTSTPKPESPVTERTTLGPRSRLSRQLAAAALVFAFAAGAGVIVLSAFTSWWVLFALFAVLPPLMMAGCLAMMSSMRRRIGFGPCFAGPCVRWLDTGSGRATWAD